MIHACVGGGAAVLDVISALVARSGRAVVHVEAPALSDRLADIAVLLCGIPPAIDWSSARSLRFLQLMGSGVDNLWPATGLPETVTIANARGIHLPEMRDHALALILAFERGVPELVAAQRERQWRPFAPGSVSGKTVGILGLGEVGRSIALACAALGMRVVGTRAESRPTPHVDRVYPPAGHDEVCRSADYVVITLPLTRRTRNLVCAESLARMRPSAVIVHLSRGGILDEAALEAALRAGELRGAALDVFVDEPLPETSTLWSTPNLLVSPHIAGWTTDYVERAIHLFLSNLELVERELPPATLVIREREY